MDNEEDRTKNSIGRELEVLGMIIDDMEKDVLHFDGQPFDGKTLAQIHGTLAATIQALARILKKHLEREAKS